VTVAIIDAYASPTLTAPYALEVCDLPICLGIDDVFNFTSLSATPYNGLTPPG
jgi:hypothetical protein